jgi:hypothetical protein
MYVNLCYRTPNMPKNKIKVVRERMTIKEAEEYYNEKLKGKVSYAYLRYFKDWSYRTHKVLYKENNE